MKRILLVEDNEDIREALAETLRDSGYDVSEAANGKEALDHLASLSDGPCLVLLDLMMPVMSGPELLKLMQENQRLASLPVIVLSAAGQPENAPTAKRFIRKPPDQELLLKLIEEYCRDDETPS